LLFPFRITVSSGFHGKEWPNRDVDGLYDDCIRHNNNRFRTNEIVDPGHYGSQSLEYLAELASMFSDAWGGGFVQILQKRRRLAT
jgi:hypothetical protein